MEKIILVILGSVVANYLLGTVKAFGTTSVYYDFVFQTQMRDTPTIAYSTLQVLDPAVASYDITNLSITAGGNDRTQLLATTSGLADKGMYMLRTKDANSYLAFSTEL